MKKGYLIGMFVAAILSLWFSPGFAYEQYFTSLELCNGNGFTIDGQLP